MSNKFFDLCAFDTQRCLCKKFYFKLCVLEKHDRYSNLTLRCLNAPNLNKFIGRGNAVVIDNFFPLREIIGTTINLSKEERSR